MSSLDSTRQLRIIHLSDLHFGSAHRFTPPPAPAGDIPIRRGFPTLADKLLEDLKGQVDCPLITCITGDLTTTGSFSEFQEAMAFIRRISAASISGRPCGLDRVFIVPGNHDVEYNVDDVSARWTQWTSAFNELYGTNHRRDDPWSFCHVHDRSDDIGVIVAAINSCIHVRRGSADEVRGHIDVEQLERLTAQLEEIDQANAQSAIRVALIHHHPILIPALAEPGRGYDAVHNAGLLLKVLRRFGFHLVLHGHKHHPHTFTDDSCSAFEAAKTYPIVVVAGGSVGSMELPDCANRRNSYNQIDIKWHPGARQIRIAIQTRVLVTSRDDGSDELPSRWVWRTGRLDERQYLGGSKAPSQFGFETLQFGANVTPEDERARQHQYARLRGNMPVLEVMPSLIPGQAYEARVWLVGHHNREVPRRVVWSAGPRFPELVCDSDSSCFCGIFNYWGPMLVQAILEFGDGRKEHAYVYARIPSNYEGA